MDKNVLGLKISDLPAEVLTEIIIKCNILNLAAVSETCKLFATIAFSTPRLWTMVNLHPHQFTNDGPNFLRTRILRTRSALLHVAFSFVEEYTAEVSALCKVLEEYNDQIHSFELTTDTAMVAGAVVHGVFPNTKAFPALKLLSILSDSEVLDPLDAVWPRLDLVLADAVAMFPNIQKLLMNIFYDSVPMLPLSASFPNLCTLVLDGAFESNIPSPELIASFLNCMPQLETLWIKHFLWHTFDDFKGRLPKLKRLAVSVPGIMYNLIAFIAAPVLEDLHLDDSRDPDAAVESTPSDEGWSDRRIRSMETVLRSLARRCRSVRRLALLAVDLGRTGWDWILFGSEDGSGPPFPKLESIALHGIRYDYLRGGFDGQLLKRFARQQMIPLKRLMSGSTLVEALRTSGIRELEYCHGAGTPQWDAEEREQLQALGVSLRCWWPYELHELHFYQWWNRGHGIDETDSKLY
ncbi:hypothetical protein F5887DRAFT_973818 [Amanita rubescens]|nr:hypothetical protein F5887DRAFT_973818 [Amanita rubescens]